MPTAVVRDDDGVVCSGEEGGTTVVRSRKMKRRRWIQPVHITSRQIGGTHTQPRAHDQIRGAPEPDVRTKKQHHKSYKGKQEAGYRYADISRDTNVFPLGQFKLIQQDIGSKKHGTVTICEQPGFGHV